MDEIDPVVVDAAVDSPVVSEKGAIEPKAIDRDELREHRARVLELQGLTPDHLGTSASPSAKWRDLALALVYTLYVVPISWIVFKYARSGEELLAAGGLISFATVFLVSFWKSYARSARFARRTRVYAGVLVEERDRVAVFEGGDIDIPVKCRRELVPGVRYRIHAPGTEDVAVDVDLDDSPDDVAPTAYRSLTR